MKFAQLRRLAASLDFGVNGYEILKQLEAKMSSQTLMSMEQPPPAASLIVEATDDES